MRWGCRLLVTVIAVTYALALALLAVGTYGLFGAERTPLAGVFLLPLGLPWNRLLDAAPEPLQQWLAIASPAVNLLLLWLICRWHARRREGISGG